MLSNSKTAGAASGAASAPATSNTRRKPLRWGEGHGKKPAGRLLSCVAYCYYEIECSTTGLPAAYRFPDFWRHWIRQIRRIRFSVLEIQMTSSHKRITALLAIAAFLPVGEAWAQASDALLEAPTAASAPAPSAAKAPTNLPVYGTLPSSIPIRIPIPGPTGSAGFVGAAPAPASSASNAAPGVAEVGKACEAAISAGCRPLNQTTYGVPLVPRPTAVGGGGLTWNGRPLRLVPRIAPLAVPGPAGP